MFSGFFRAFAPTVPRLLPDASRPAGRPFAVASGTPAERLAEGAAGARRVRVGDLLVVEDGSLDLLGPPQWLGDTLVSVPVRVAAGQAHRFADAGWVSLVARSPARLRWTRD